MEIEKDSADVSWSVYHTINMKLKSTFDFCSVDTFVKTENDEYSCVSPDGEDFFGFEAEDLNYGTVESSKGVTEMENVNHDLLVVENMVKSENDTSCTDPLDCKEADDEIIFVENNVEVIEIDDDSDSEVLLNLLQTAENKTFMLCSLVEETV